MASTDDWELEGNWEEGTYEGCLHTALVYTFGALTHTVGNFLLMNTNMNFVSSGFEVLGILS